MQYPKNLLDIKQLSQTHILNLFERANQLKQKTIKSLQQKNIALLFFEPSTRTVNSFTLAASHLGATVIAPSCSQSAIQKGESLIDNALTLVAMGIDCIVIRHPDNNAAKMLADALNDWPVSIINAGDGTNQHPTQGLLDLYTIAQHTSDWSALRVCIIGDILHSRVANSLIDGLNIMGVTKIRVSGPKKLLPKAHNASLIINEDPKDALHDADVVVTLRLQKERMSEALIPEESIYFNTFGIDQKKLALAKAGALVMHPGPINRDVEIAADVACGKQSVILEQVKNGVLMRAALFNSLLQQGN